MARDEVSGDPRRQGERRGERRVAPPLDSGALQRLGLRYVERFATTRGRLVDYLRRKLRERGWEGEGAPDPEALADRFAELGYIDDRSYAEARAASMARRGLGARRVRDAFRRDGIEQEDADALAPDIDARAAEAALAYARRKRLGPFAASGTGSDAPADRAVLARQLAAMARAGHAYPLARRILELPPGADTDPSALI